MEVLARLAGEVEQFEQQGDFAVVGRAAEGQPREETQVLLGGLARRELVLAFARLVPAVDWFLVARVPQTPIRPPRHAFGHQKISFQQVRGEGEEGDLIVVARR